MTFTGFLDVIRTYSKRVGRNIIVVPDQKYPGFYIHSMTGNFAKVGTTGLGSAGNVNISADCVLSSDKSLGLCGIVLKCNVQGGCQIKGKDVFSLFIDGSEITPHAQESSYAVNNLSIMGEKYTVEVLRYRVEKEIIDRLGSASTVTFEVRGKKKKIGGTLTRKNLDRFRQFYDNCLVNMRPFSGHKISQ